MKPDPRSKNKKPRCNVCGKPVHKGADGKDQRKSKGRK